LRGAGSGISRAGDEAIPCRYNKALIAINDQRVMGGRRRSNPMPIQQGTDCIQRSAGDGRQATKQSHANTTRH